MGCRSCDDFTKYHLNLIIIIIINAYEKAKNSSFDHEAHLNSF